MEDDKNVSEPTKDAQEAELSNTAEGKNSVMITLGKKKTLRIYLKGEFIKMKCYSHFHHFIILLFY